MSSRKKSLDASVSSDERKRKHENTAPHGPAARGKTYIGGNSLDTCTQGSTPATGHPTTNPLATDQSPNVQTMTPEQTIPRPSRDSNSDNETETWSFDRAINEVFRLLPPELCPRSTEEHTPARPLSGIEQLMESQLTPLMMLPQSKLIENSARFLQDKIDSEKCDRDWVYSQNLASSLTQTKFYKSHSRFFPTDNIPPLEAEASLLDLSNKGKYSIPMRNLEIW